jgi:hypothetical protein
LQAPTGVGHADRPIRARRGSDARRPDCRPYRRRLGPRYGRTILAADSVR